MRKNLTQKNSEGGFENRPCVPWRKYRIGIYSEPMRIIPNQSEKPFVTRLMKNGKKSIRPDPI